MVLVKATGGSEEKFKTIVETEACRLMASVTGDSRRVEPVAFRMAAKITSWTWNVLRVPAPPKDRLKGPELATRLAEGGRKAAASRKARSEQVIVAAALDLAANCSTPTQAMVQARSGAGEKTIRRHWSAVQTALAGRLTRRNPCAS